MSDPDRRRLPPVRAVLDWPGLAGFREQKGHVATVRAVRAAIDEAREALIRGGDPSVDVEALGRRAMAALEGDRPRLRPVLNATGILLNTGLGRAPLAAEAVEAVARVARGYCNLEFDLDRGVRGRRTDGVEALLARLTGAEAAAVVNNNAAATILAVRALAAGREVVVSRGELVEIGGNFRLPEIIEASGARLREVGTTNKTRLADYARAIGPQTAALLRVHPSNFRVVGFTESVPIADLAALAREHDLWTIDDIGSGALTADPAPHARGEPTAAHGIAAGADLVLFSGDKLLGGPQCGILVGSKEAIDPVRRDPLMRALRVDKMTLAALEATLRLLLDGANDRIPLRASLMADPRTLRDRARRLARSFRADLGLAADACRTRAYLGGGSAPASMIPSAAVRIRPPFPAPGQTEGDWSRALRRGDPPVVARVHRGSVLLDLIAIPEADEAMLARAVRDASRGAG